MASHFQKFSCVEMFTRSATFLLCLSITFHLFLVLVVLVTVFTYAVRFNCHFPGEPVLDSFSLLDFSSPFAPVTEESQLKCPMLQLTRFKWHHYVLHVQCLVFSTLFFKNVTGSQLYVLMCLNMCLKMLVWYEMACSL